MKTTALSINFYDNARRFDENIECSVTYPIGEQVASEPMDPNPRFRLVVHDIVTPFTLPALSFPLEGFVVDCGSSVIGIMVVNLETGRVAARCASKAYYEKMQLQAARKDELKRKWATVLTA